MTVAKRLYLLIISAILGLAGLAGFGIVEMAKVYSAANFANINTVPSLLELDITARAVNQMRTYTWQYLAVTDPVQRADIARKLAETHSQVLDSLNKYEKEDIDDDTDRALLVADRVALAEYDALRTKLLVLADADRTAEARDILLAKQSVIARLNDAMTEHAKYNADLGKKAAEDAAATLKSANFLVACIAFITVVGVAGMGLIIVRKIIRSLNGAVAIAQAVAAGDLTANIEVTSKDETGQLLQALKDMNGSLVNIVGQVRNGTDTISTASRQIASGNLDLSSRTEEQASSLEETASSMEELTSTVKQNADNARQANQLAISASEVAVKGGAVVAQVVDTMGSINGSAKKIVDIIGVIDGIAFQTNILALNAAVEAARAGEQGRGFAVVASEVRNLAQRAASAAKEIKALIDDSVEKVEAGSKLVDQAGTTMQAIVGSIRSVTDIMGEITVASQEQTSGIEQINRAIVQMDDVTQQNAALVEEAAAASQSLQNQVDSLAQVVGIFKIGKTQTAVIAKSNKTSHSTQVKAAGQKIKPATSQSTNTIYPTEKLKLAGSEEDWEEF